MTRQSEDNDGDGSDDNNNVAQRSYLLKQRRLSISLDSLAIMNVQNMTRNSLNICVRNTGNFTSNPDLRICRSVGCLICQSVFSDDESDKAQLTGLSANFKYPSKRLQQLVSETSDYASSDNSPEIFSSNPLLDALLSSAPNQITASEDYLVTKTTEEESQQANDKQQNILLELLSHNNSITLSSYNEPNYENVDCSPEKVLSLDSASSWLKTQVSLQLASSSSAGTLEHQSYDNSTESSNSARPILHSTISCPALSTPSIIIDDYSEVEGTDECSSGLTSDQVVTNNSIYLAISRGFVGNSKPRRIDRRFSSFSTWSSTTSLSTLTDDDDCDRWSSADMPVKARLSAMISASDHECVGGYVEYQKSFYLTVKSRKWEYGEASSDDLSSDWDTESEDSSKSIKTSRWKQVRNVVHWSPFVQTYKKQKYPWIQLSGHQGNFKSGGPGTILKKITGAEESCFVQLQSDPLNSFIPKFIQKKVIGSEPYLELEDLLAKFEMPAVIDIKMGIRTYLEDELAKAREKPKLRKDMYDKMIQIDPNEPTEEENRLKAVTKPRYMIWRETISSTATLGFRLEGVKYADGSTSKDFKTSKTESEVKEALTKFTANNSKAVTVYLERLHLLRETLLTSPFFKQHELIGSSLLLIHDVDSASFWMIDFAKTYPLPNGLSITHCDEWNVGNHEDGYLIGVDSLIRIFESIQVDLNSER
ncbi:Inositol-trisphosphate 3-kinase B [Halotydeus destructor]|nr:Inositol-trisphosphate 3-kinase B [Halotydeus destructor]